MPNDTNPNRHEHEEEQARLEAQEKRAAKVDRYVPTGLGFSEFARSKQDYHDAMEKHALEYTHEQSELKASVRKLTHAEIQALGLVCALAHENRHSDVHAIDKAARSLEAAAAEFMMAMPSVMDVEVELPF